MGLLWACMETGGALLLEEPELSLHTEIVRMLPQMLARVQRKNHRQIVLSTHSAELLQDDGIGLDETLLIDLQPGGATVASAASRFEIRQLIEAGLSLADAVIPQTRPALTDQLALFGDS